MRFASLGSGSEGNGLVVEAGPTRLLLDCGFSLRDATRRLARIGLDPADLAGIIVTHEHSDHIGGVFPLARRFGLPVWITHGTFAAICEPDPHAGASVEVTLIHGETRFAVGDLQVHPFTVPHDAREPVQYVLSDGARRLGVLTDTGCSTPHVEEMLSGCEALVLEANHDPDMLRWGDYPPALQARIAGRFGHLDNAAAGEILSAIDRRRLQHVVAAHLSKKNNRPGLAREAFAVALGCEEDWVAVASQEEGFGWRDIA
ncbi:MAG: MBL fold metallo-hydrolase [Betaproteobacteria bacterium RIFCSPLOWO2_02_FULL_65_20]|nr:MAG: MBL fold metallo-hydrolase [Betaproteobacteria bacterium RIFCSPLOWO2_02_FULL_65_20]